MTTALVYFGVSTAVLLALSFLFMVEDARGSRLVLVGVRVWLDRAIVVTVRACRNLFQVTRQRIVQLILHYGVRRFLNAAVAYLRNLERRVEYAVLYNRQAAKKTKKRDRNHLDEIAEHKEASALSDEEKMRYRSHE